MRVVVILVLLGTIGFAACKDDNPTVPVVNFDIVCVSCEFQYSIRWRQSSNQSWTEVSSSRGSFCIYEGVLSNFDSYCYSIQHAIDLNGITTVPFDVEAQNGFGAWSDAGCFGADVGNGEIEPYTIPCFPL